MTDQDNLNFDDFQPDDTFTPVEASETPAPAAAGNNRTFLIAIGVIGAIFLVGLIVMGIMAATILPQRQAARNAEQALVQATNDAIAVQATQDAEAYALAQMPSPTIPPTPTLPPPTNTPVVATIEPTVAPTQPGADKAELPDPAVQTQMAATAAAQGPTLAPGAARTATLAVLLTQVAGNQNANQAAAGGGGPTSTALPSTGFADEVGLPGLFAAAIGLLILILLARSLRLATR